MPPRGTASRLRLIRSNDFLWAHWAKCSMKATRHSTAHGVLTNGYIAMRTRSDEGVRVERLPCEGGELAPRWASAVRLLRPLQETNRRAYSLLFWAWTQCTYVSHEAAVRVSGSPRRALLRVRISEALGHIARGTAEHRWDTVSRSNIRFLYLAAGSEQVKNNSPDQRRSGELFASGGWHASPGELALRSVFPMYPSTTHVSKGLIAKYDGYTHCTVKGGIKWLEQVDSL